MSSTRRRRPASTVSMGGPEVPRRSLDTAAVVREAVRLADEQGVDSLTMRQLGARLGVQAMSLYRYVGGREALLDAMVAAMMNQLSSTLTPNLSTPTTGSAYLQQTAHDVRNLALTHPWLIRLMVLRPPPAPWLSRPLDSLACTERFLQALHHRGFDSTSSVRIYRGFCAFLLAHLLIEVSAPTAEPPPRRQPGRGPPSSDPVSRYPLLASQLLAVEDHPAEFERALHLFVHSVGQVCAEDATYPRPAPHPTRSRSSKEPDDDRGTTHHHRHDSDRPP